MFYFLARRSYTFVFFYLLCLSVRICVISKYTNSVLKNANFSDFKHWNPTHPSSNTLHFQLVVIFHRFHYQSASFPNKEMGVTRAISSCSGKPQKMTRKTKLLQIVNDGCCKSENATKGNLVDKIVLLYSGLAWPRVLLNTVVHRGLPQGTSVLLINLVHLNVIDWWFAWSPSKVCLPFANTFGGLFTRWTHESKGYVECCFWCARLSLNKIQNIYAIILITKHKRRLSSRREYSFERGRTPAVVTCRRTIVPSPLPHTWTCTLVPLSSPSVFFSINL